MAADKKVGPKSVLMTPDPYHVPGYGGYCSQFKYQIGNTFGRTTSKLLTDSSVPSSGNLVLVNIYPSLSVYQREEEAKKTRISTRTQSWGDQKLRENMVPGYTGFIPRSLNFYGKRYAKNSLNAISDFEDNQKMRKSYTNELHMIESLQSGRTDRKPEDQMPKILSQHKTPLVAVADKPKPFISKDSNTVYPQFISHDVKNKKFMSGYTGFVPRARGLLGSGYPDITNIAINEFSSDLKQKQVLDSQPVRLHREPEKSVITRPVYPVDSGLVPHYTGHIPGEKFRYGDTFGHSTMNALATKRKATVVTA